MLINKDPILLMYADREVREGKMDNGDYFEIKRVIQGHCEHTCKIRAVRFLQKYGFEDFVYEVDYPRRRKRHLFPLPKNNSYGRTSYNPRYCKQENIGRTGAKGQLMPELSPVVT